MHSLRNTAIAAVLFAVPLYANAATSALASINPSSAEQHLVRDDAAIRPYHIAIPQAALDDLRKRVRATRWPDKETVTDQSQGVQLARIQALVQYWGLTTTGARSRRSSTRCRSSLRRSMGWTSISFT